MSNSLISSKPPRPLSRSSSRGSLRSARASSPSIPQSDTGIAPSPSIQTSFNHFGSFLFPSGCSQSDVDLEALYSSPTGTVTQLRKHHLARTTPVTIWFHVVSFAPSLVRRCLGYQSLPRLIYHQLFNSKNAASFQF